MIQRITTLAAVFVLGLALPCAGNEVRGLPHEKIAKDFLVMHGLADKAPGDVSIDAVLARDFVSTRVGFFDVYFPIAGLEGRSGDLKECLAALLDAQEQILDWSKPAGRDQKVVRADLKTVSGWVKGMRAAGAAKIKDAGGKDLTALLSAPEAVTAAQKRLAESLGKGEALGLSLDPPARLRVLLAPTRREFVELVCFVGWWSEEWKSTYWVDSIADWSTCWMDDVQVIALEYAPGGHAPDDYASGEALNKRDPKVMEQQLVQLSVYRVFEYLYGERVPVAFLGGLAMNLVIDQFGEINTRVDGDLRGRTAARREVFVAGGASGGGFLAKNSAETRWREDHGKDRFVRVLRLSQKEGDGLDKELKNRLAGFAVRSDAGGEVHAVAAPFLGAAAAEAKPPPDAFAGDFAEMQRGYKCAFIYWLQAKSDSAEKGAREKFARLLEKLADPSVEFESVFPAVYEGAALSDPAAGKESLEGQFLVWLSKQK
jgi:hypothetical protein